MLIYRTFSINPKHQIPMIRRISIFMLVIGWLAPGAWAQEDNPVLFTVADKPVRVSEFTYIYEKTNGKAADYSQESLEEYLDLYTKFKLKVQRARDMQLDTIPSLQRELAGYRRQLADSYLVDRQVTEKLVREAYERMKQDVDISHILIDLAPNAAPEDTLQAFQEAMEARRRIQDGEAFTAVARELSDDESASNNGGRVGFVKALFPEGLYALETAAYNQPVGALSKPIRTRSGYHILKVHKRRPARGEIEAAHILLRTEGKDPAAVKERIDSLYRALENGAEFAALARQYSEDRATRSRGGYLGFFGINLYAEAFEDAAFALEKDSAYSQPVQTKFGWHLIQRISKRNVQPYELEKRRLKTRIQKYPRFERAKLAMIENIKAESGFEENPAALQTYVDSLDASFSSFRWEPPQYGDDPPTLFTIGNAEYTARAFSEYLSRSVRQRVSRGRNRSPEFAARALYQEFVQDKCMAYEEKKLEEKYPEFRALMREYEEGILLFEATKLEVWDKASQDSAGLRDYYERYKNKYRWPERAAISRYQIDKSAADKLEVIREFAATHQPEATLQRFNDGEEPIVSVEEEKMEKTQNDIFVVLPWKTGAVSKVKQTKRGDKYVFTKLEEILPPRVKTLEEARGYVIADYQDYLEKQWLSSLRERYEVEVDREVLNQLVREKAKE